MLNTQRRGASERVHIPSCRGARVTSTLPYILYHVSTPMCLNAHSNLSESFGAKGSCTISQPFLSRPRGVPRVTFRERRRARVYTRHSRRPYANVDLRGERSLARLLARNTIAFYGTGAETIIYARFVKLCKMHRRGGTRGNLLHPLSFACTARRDEGCAYGARGVAFRWQRKCKWYRLLHGVEHVPLCTEQEDDVGRKSRSACWRRILSCPK